ncbi:cation-transporting P-type ATPase [Streptomyces sp. KM273126]|uniref:cation-translocating P-type ATPase n=1 Tax=Streptomyces sp. KM273126 TaxID=2545247 RepID=UPI0010392764|nr:cation-transporting P-type ATPase [Streptomyces sp. KM273126]MBA2808209.1 cation-transporting P-type ATPase [Streptomyces sp. KM273126]
MAIPAILAVRGLGELRAAVSSAAGAAQDVPAARVRRVDGRAHVAVRGLREGHLPDSAAARLADEVERRLAAVPGVDWAVANAVLGHVVVATEGPPDAEEIVAALADVVEEVEREHRVDAPLPDHPLSGGKARRSRLALALHVAAAPVAAAVGLTRRAPLPPAFAALVPIVDTQPRLRRLVEQAVGPGNARLLLAALTAVGHAASGGVLGSGVDAVRHALHLMEANAEDAAWSAAMPHLTSDARRAGARGGGHEAPPRKTPLKSGPVEHYADRAPAVAAASFAGSFLVTRRSGRAGAAALAAVPKAPLLARDGFACVLGRGLAHRGVLVADPDALRRLDRIGTVLLDTDALATGSHLLADLVALDEDAPVGELAATAHRLFDGTEPESPRRDGAWELGPVERLTLHGRTGARAQERLRREGARFVLGLAHERRLMAVISVVPEMHDTASAFVPAAHAAGLTVVAAGAHTADAAVREADDLLDGGKRLSYAVRRLQRDGEGVLVISRNRSALGAADVGVGIAGPHGVPPWGADLYVGSDPAAAVVIVEACRSAREAAQRGVRLAQASAVVGATAALAGRGRHPAARSVASYNAAGGLGTAIGAWTAVWLLRRPLPLPASHHPWHAMDPATVLARAGGHDEGLTDEEVRERATVDGEKAPASSLGRAYVTEMANPLTPVLGVGAAMSATVGAVLDSVIIMAVTALSGLIGGFQRYRTDRAVARLRREAAVTAKVVRDGQETTASAEDLAVGDVVNLSAGDVVPADCRLLESHHLEADESALTGESLPVAKGVAPVLASDLADRTSMVYEGTTVAAGTGRAVVVATGSASEAGRAALAGRGAAPSVGVERRLARITRTTLPVALGSAVAVMAAGMLRGRPTRDTVGAGVGLAVASVPEGLPFLVSAAQLASARRLSARGALVRDPRTVEAAGRTDVLCFDKTGTLTHGRISLVAVAADGDSRPLGSLGDEQRAVLGAALRATPRPHGDRGFEHATDGAVTEGAREAGVARTAAAPGWRRTSSLPFEPSRGFHATRGRSGESLILSVKGAPEEVVDRCVTRGGRPLDEESRRAILATGERLAAEGHRVLAVAERRGATDGRLTDDAVTGLGFLGFLAFADRVRPTAADAVRRLADAGVHIVMITGDHPGTAESMARELGVLDGRRVVTGAELDELDEHALDALLPEIGVVARGTPVHKVHVVQAFQRLGRTVAMTGDGANDAPAIRLADVGIAFGTRATPAARAAADLVVTDDRLETVLAALVEGRAMWASVRQALAILVGGNFGEIAFTLLGAVATGTSPLTARQLLLVNLFTDLAPAIAVALRPPHPEAAERMLHEGPESSLGEALAEETVTRAVATTFGATAAWLPARLTGRPVRARTIALVALVGAQLGQTLLAGGTSRAIVVSSLGSLAALAAVVQTPVLSQFFGCTPLGPVAWTIALSAATAATLSSLFLPTLIAGVRTAGAKAIAGATAGATGDSTAGPGTAATGPGTAATGPGVAATAPGASQAQGRPASQGHREGPPPTAPRSWGARGADLLDHALAQGSNMLALRTGIGIPPG